MSDYSLATPALQELTDPEAIAWQCHEHHQPLGKRLPSEIRRELRNHLERCLVTLEMLPNGEGALHQTPVAFNDIGRLEVYQQLYFIVLHAQRHLHQMKKIGEEFDVDTSPASNQVTFLVGGCLRQSANSRSDIESKI